MTDEEYNEIMEACHPHSATILYIIAGTSPQEQANYVWMKLGEKHGFQWDTAQPVLDKPDRFFTAISLKKTGSD